MDREQVEKWAREAGMDDAVVSNYHGQFRMVNAKSLEHFARRLERERDEARAERDAEKEEIMTICAAGAESERQLHEAREALREMKELAEFWINREDRRGMCESAWRTWHALGHGSKAMLRARTVLGEGD